MVKRVLMLMTAAGFMLTGAKPLAAQAWDVPSFLGPRPMGEVGAALVVPQGADWGVKGWWRQPGTINLGVNVGYINLNGNGSDAFLIGADARGLVLESNAAFPVDLAWTVGVGGTFGSDITEVRIPLGATAGFGLPVGETLFLFPYVHPRIGVDVDLDDSPTETRVGFTADVGLDVFVGNNFALRFGGSVIDRPGWGIGLSWIFDRPVRVAALR